MKTPFLITIALTLSVILSSHAIAGPMPSELEAKGISAMESGAYEDAEQIFRELIELRPKSFVGHYNLAAAHSMQGEVEEAIDAMSTALALGFCDKAQMYRDPDLKSLRLDPWFDILMEQWGGLIDARRGADIAQIELLFPNKRKLWSHTDETLRFELRSAHGEIATDEAMEELRMIAGWAHAELFPELPGMDLSDSAWIMIGLPDQAGFAKWAISVFGSDVRGSISSVGGAYEHQARRLVAQDLGATLRHEFVHVLHWRDMSRLGQVHAPWVQEGLASLIEDYDIRGERPVPMPSWRTNIVQRLERINRLPSFEELSQIEMNAFTAKRPLAKYAQARTAMLWLLDTDKLGDFYTHYCQNYEDDPTGYASVLAVTGLEPDELERQYRNWVEALPAVPETGSDLSATLGIEVENGTGDGVVVRGLPAGASRRTGLRLGSVITHINGRPTRDLLELIRVLGDYGAGQRVTLHHRRGTVHKTSEATLIER